MLIEMIKMKPSFWRFFPFKVTFFTLFEDCYVAKGFTEISDDQSARLNFFDEKKFFLFHNSFEHF